MPRRRLASRLIRMLAQCWRPRSSMADKLAFEKASKYAMKEAEKKGLLDAHNAAKQAAEEQAAEMARLQAGSLAHEAAAWKRRREPT